VVGLVGDGYRCENQEDYRGGDEGGEPLSDVDARPSYRVRQREVSRLVLELAGDRISAEEDSGEHSDERHRYPPPRRIEGEGGGDEACGPVVPDHACEDSADDERDAEEDNESPRPEVIKEGIPHSDADLREAAWDLMSG